ncbi:MAG: DNA-binding protein [Candidatus Micrarchaeota archaeon]|nr:DNA-binding protein [Candidatus Micrarchaeota archaeon]
MPKNAGEKEPDQEQVMEYLRVFSAKILEPEAYSRLLLIKGKNPQLFMSIMQTLIYLYQNGKLLNKINEQQLLELARKILSGQEPKKESKIIIKRKGD